MRIYRGAGQPEGTGKPLAYLLTFCRHHGLIVTSGEHLQSDGTEVYPHGGHNGGSLHYCGRAVDVSTRGRDDVPHVIAQAVALGINVLDERERPARGVWTGPHLHLSLSPPGSRLV